MLSNFGFGEIVLMAVLGMIIFGPERLPGAARDAGKLIRKVRSMTDSALDEVKSGLGPEFADLDPRSLHPRGLVNRLLTEDDSAPAATRTTPDPEPTAGPQETSHPVG